MDLELKNVDQGWLLSELEGWDTKRTTSVREGQTRSHTMEEVMANRERKRTELQRELDVKRTLTILGGNTERSARQHSENISFRIGE